MAGTPEIEAPGADEAQQPTPVMPTPPLAAFGGAVVGDVVSKIAKEEYMKSVEAVANQANADYQNFALDTRQQYLNKYGGYAINAHAETVQALQQKRQEMLESMTSRTARRLFADNTQRVLRLAQESVDSHFVQQNKVVQFGSYQKLVKSSVNMAATLASQGKLDEAIGEVDKAYTDGIKQYTKLGFDDDTAEKMAAADRAIIAASVVRSMSKIVEAPAEGGPNAR